MPVRLIKGLEGAAFGLVDGVICISGMIIGVAIVTSDIRIIFISAITGGLTDALGNSIGIYLSGYSERGAQIHSQEHGIKTSVDSTQEILFSAILSFLVTLGVVAIMLLPFLFLDIGKSLIFCIIFSLMALSGLGIYVGKLSGEKPIKTSIKFVLLGIIGIVFSYFIGSILKAVLYTFFT